jgi:hypothetical protein
MISGSRFALTLACSLSLIACQRINTLKNIEAIKDVMDRQAKCWSDGDLEGYMEGYWKSDSLRFMGLKGITFGWQQTLDRYRKSYPDRATMGRLTFEHISFDQLGSNNMFVVGKWKLERDRDTVGGYYSLLWAKIDGEWKIIFDHTP